MIYFLGIVGVVMLALGGFGGYEKLRADHAVKRAELAEAKLTLLDRERIAQQERRLQLTAAEEVRARQQETDRAKRFAGRAAAAASDGTLRGIHLTDAARRMLGDAYAAASAAGTTSEPKDPAPADSKTVADSTAWGIRMLDWASLCRDRVDTWERWYDQLRNTP